MPTTTTDAPLHGALPADVDAPDRILLDLTARQVAVLAAGASVVYLSWRGLHPLLPTGALVALAIPVVAVTAVLALGRRDGLPLEVWALHAARFRRAPRRLLPARSPRLPGWAPSRPGEPPAGVLRLPAAAVTPDGVLHLDHGHGPGRRSVMLVAASTVNLTARSPGDQTGLVAGLAAWLNGLAGPAQIVVSSRPVDLTAHALRIADTVHLAGDRALAEAGIDHARFLLDLMTDRDPLARTVTVAITATGPDADATARRAADTTAAALSGLGTTVGVLDGAAVTAALTAGVDPYQPGAPGSSRAASCLPVTGHATGRPS